MTEPLPEPTTPPPPPGPIDPEMKRRYLAQAVQREVAAGQRVESQTDESAVLVMGKPVNHILHLILTLVTCFIWSPVWIVLAITGGEKRIIVSIDDYGNTLRQVVK